MRGGNDEKSFRGNYTCFMDHRRSVLSHIQRSSDPERKSSDGRDRLDPRSVPDFIFYTYFDMPHQRGFQFFFQRRLGHDHLYRFLSRYPRDRVGIYYNRRDRRVVSGHIRAKGMIACAVQLKNIFRKEVRFYKIASFFTFFFCKRILTNFR